MREAVPVTGAMTPGARGDLAGAGYGQQVRGVDFAGVDLTTVSTPAVVWIERCSFAGADLRQATLDGAHLKMCDLRGADLAGASLRGTSFAGCDLAGADLRGADLHGASFTAVNTGDRSGASVLSGAVLDEGALDDVEVDPTTALP